ncbi:MAG: type 4a pilus biogenesis protein PilO, partial [Candidatus Eisenbacteria sp.]|nr:type 4a pilus biogenesis protein PilO [Candidatus Eisenbacteria bacterium]
METTGKSERKPVDKGAARPDNLDAVPLDPIVEAADAEDTELCEVTSCAGDSEGAEDAAGAENGGAVDETDNTDGDPECDAFAAPAGLARLRSKAQLSIDFDWLTDIWRAHSLARVAFMAVFVCVLAIGSAYFFMMQPLSTRLHEVREQKGVLHDYMVIQQAGAAISSFKDGLMTGDQRLTVMSEVRLMAEGSGVKIVGDPDLLLRRDVSGHFVEYPIRLRVRGSFHEIGEFLSLLEGSPRFVLVEEIEIRSDVASRNSESEAPGLLALAA